MDDCNIEPAADPLVFDLPLYQDCLTWLGAPSSERRGAIRRPFHDGLWDARGSWPYQSVPSIEAMQRLQDMIPEAPLTFTAVIRPDIQSMRLNGARSRLGAHFATTLRCLKDHLAHVPHVPSVRDTYSLRTRDRLAHARTVFRVERTPLASRHLVMADFQNRLKALRDIPDASSPDADHFTQLIVKFSGSRDDVACMTLTRDGSHAVEGVFLLFASQGPCPSWHAHSLLVSRSVLADFGSYLLFDAAIEALGDRSIWFGGAPSGHNGPGVFHFKQRFSNHSQPAHILCVDLNGERLRDVRARFGPFAWLPDYRDPHPLPERVSHVA